MIKVPLNLNSDSVWGARVFGVTGAILYILIAVFLFSLFFSNVVSISCDDFYHDNVPTIYRLSKSYDGFFHKNIPIIYRTVDGKTELNQNPLVLLAIFIVALSAPVTISYLISVLIRSIFKEQLKWRVEEERKGRFREVRDKVAKLGECWAEEAIKLSRTKRERKSVETALKKYHKEVFLFFHIHIIASGDVSDKTINDAKRFMKLTGIKDEETDTILSRAIGVGKITKGLRTVNKDLFRSM